MADDSKSSNSSDSDSGSVSESEPKRSENRQTSQSAGNVFKNDGSFMEMFKKMQDERTKKDSNYFDNPVKKESEQPTSESSLQSISDSGSGPPVDENLPSTSLAMKKPSVRSFVGKRRGGRILPTGIVKKPKRPDLPQEDGEKNDAWSRYLSEVRKYREQSCEEEGKRRPLVK